MTFTTIISDEETETDPFIHQKVLKPSNTYVNKCLEGH